MALVQGAQGGAERLSYAELCEAAAALAAGLRSGGLAPGDRAILHAPNSIAWVTVCLAMLRAGVVPVPVDSQIGADDLAHIVADSGAAWAFTTTLGLERLGSTGVSRSLRCVLLDRAAEHGEHWRDLLAAEHGIAPNAEAGADSSAAPGDCAVLFYTSGTTGPPKGVPLTHINLTSNMQALIEQRLVAADDRLLLPLPLHHVYPFVVGLLVPLQTGMTVVLPRSLVGSHFLAAMGEQVTVLLGVPRLYSALLGAIEQSFRSKGRVVLGAYRAAMKLAIGAARRLGIDTGPRLFAGLRRRIAPDLRLVVSGGSALDLDIAERLEALGWPLATGYGLTETSPILALNVHGACPLDSAGKPLPGVELRIADPGPGFRDGEVQAKGPNVFSGYRNLPERTHEAFTPDGWFRTGDLGYFDASGALHLVGRASSMIVLPGGENIVPDNLEERLEQCPSIAEAGVLERGGRLVGVIVPERECARSLGPAELEARIRNEIATLAKALPSYQRLGEVTIDGAPLPRTRLGKIRRKKLAERYAALVGGAPRGEASDDGSRAPSAEPPELSAEDRQLLEDPVAAQVWVWLEQRFRGQTLAPDTHLGMELGVDSLEWLSLTLEIRNLVAIELSDEAVGRIETVRDLLEECTTAERALGSGGDVLEMLRNPETLLDEAELARLRPHPLQSAMLDALAVLAARVLMRVAFRFRVEGLEHLPSTGPYVIAPNHSSALDPIAVAAALGRRRLGETYWGGWVGILFQSRLTSMLSRAMRVLPVEPRLGPLANLGLAAAVLGRGHPLVWFPEGARSLTGELQRFRPGIGFLLEAHAVPVVPVWIEGTRRALPPGSLRPRPGSVALKFGAPALVEELEADGSGNTAEERIASGLFARVAALAP